MAPMMSPLRKIRPARRLALPFVVTAVAACGPPSSPQAPAPKPAEGKATPVLISNPPRPEPVESGGTEGPQQEAPEAGTATEATSPDRPPVLRNPPPPGTENSPSETAPVEAVETPTTATKIPKAPSSGGRVQTRADGTCWWLATPDCPKNAKCNPPPPRQVNCPKK